MSPEVREAAVKEVDAARTADALAATRLASATDAWTSLMEKTFGALVVEVGRAQAEKFFPRGRKGSGGGADLDEHRA